MANYYTYGKIPSAEETVYGPLSQGYADGGVAEPKIPPGLEAAYLRMRGQSPEQLAAKAEATAQTKPQREVLSDLLQTGQFDQAFKYAKDQGVQNLLIDPTELKTLRGPFSNDEMKSFFSAMPKDLMGEHKEREVKFTPDKALEQSLQVASIPREGIAAGPLGDIIGYPDVQRAFEPQELVKEPTLFGKLIKAAVLGGLAFAGGSALAGLVGAGGAGAAGASGAAGAGAAGAGAGAAGALTGVVPTGLVAGTTAANLALPVFTVTAGGGLTAAQLAAAAAAAGGAGALTGGSSAAAPTTTTTPTPEAPLDEVVVQATRPPAIPPAAVVAPTVGALPTEPPVVEPPLEEVVVEAQRPVEPEISVPPPISPPSAPVEPPVPEAPLEEVVVETTRPVEPEIVPPPVVTPPTSPVDTAFPEGPVEEVVVETTKPTEPPVVSPPIVTPPTSPVDTAFPEGPVEEVVVETTKPTEPPIVTPPVVTPPTGPVEPPFPEGPVEEVVVETTKPPPSEEIIVPPVVVPPTTPVDIPKEPPKVNEPSPTDKIKDLLAKYGDLETLLKLLGALGSAGSKTPTAPVVTPTAPSMGGALPKYTYTRQQLSPDIDYYTYGTRPEAKFFEYGLQLEKPTQPELPQPEMPPGNLPDTQVVVTPQPTTPVVPDTPPDDLVFGGQVMIPATKDGVEGYYTDTTMRNFVPNPKPKAAGGLAGYAHGGSNKSRYFDGPGSGREDKIPALLSDGEYVMDAETLALLGDGSTKEGARRMDEFRAKIRQHKGRALSRGQISPDAKSPDKYMGGGLA